MPARLQTTRPGAYQLLRYVFAATLVASLSSCADPFTGPSESASTSDVDIAVPTIVPGCQDGVQPSGALYEVCLPAAWNGKLMVWGHGYVSALEPLAVPDDDVDGTPVSAIINALGYAYMSTSYRDNGLVAVDAASDLTELPAIFAAGVGEEPLRTYLVGGSEGGLATALALERPDPPFDGGLALCGPIGNFRMQVNHFSDFRTIFDYFFPGVMPGTPVSIPPSLVTKEQWDDVYEPAVRAAIAANPHATEQLLNVTKAPIDVDDPSSVAETVTDLLWYSFFATNDANMKLGGNPFGNRLRLYSGSDNDFWLNLLVQRFTADDAALAAMAAYETTGNVLRPEVTLHTVRDHIVPYAHEPLYYLKVLLSGASGQLIPLPTPEYGHCAFTIPEVLASFAILVLKVAAEDLVAPPELFANDAAQQEFLDLARRQGANPRIGKPVGLREMR